MILSATTIPFSSLVWALFLSVALTGCSKHPSSSSKTTSGGSSDSGSNASSSANAESKLDKSSEGGAQPNDTVNISEDDQQRAGVQTALVYVQAVPRVLSVAAQVAMNEENTVHLGTIADGRITAVSVLPGAIVHRGESLGSIHSHSVHETVGALIQAFADADRQRGAVNFARQAQERYGHLYSIQAASLEESQRATQELQQAEKMLVDAEATVRMEREHLSELLQVSPDSLRPDNLYDKELIPIVSPIDGVVVARNITVGQVVGLGFDAFGITNLSTVWVTAAVNQQDLPLIHVGATAGISDPASPSNLLRGRVTMLGDTLDAQTRTVPVRIVVPNQGTPLRPGMFVSAQIAEPTTRTALFVPEDALQDINGLQVVFATADGHTFQARTVSVGTHSLGKAEVVSGLKPGDRIVAKGAFMVKAEMLKGTIGGS